MDSAPSVGFLNLPDYKTHLRTLLHSQTLLFKFLFSRFQLGVSEICVSTEHYNSPAIREVVVNTDLGLFVQNPGGLQPVQEWAGLSNWSKLTDGKVVNFSVSERGFFFYSFS